MQKNNWYNWLINHIKMYTMINKNKPCLVFQKNLKYYWKLTIDGGNEYRKPKLEKQL